MNVKRMSLIAMLTAVGTVTAHLVSIPVGAARVFPMQHAINVIAAVLLGPVGAGLVAFLISLLRNLTGTGTLLAFPGSIVGALLAGYLYRLTRQDFAAAGGEVIGTGVIGALIAFPMARFFLNREVLAYTFIVPFSLSSLGGAVIGYLVLRALAGAGYHRR